MNLAARNALAAVALGGLTALLLIFEPRNPWLVTYWALASVVLGVLGTMLFRAPIAPGALMLGAAMMITFGLSLAVENALGRVGLAEVFYAIPAMSVWIGIAVLGYVAIEVAIRYWRRHNEQAGL